MATAKKPAKKPVKKPIKKPAAQAKTASARTTVKRTVAKKPVTKISSQPTAAAKVPKPETSRMVTLEKLRKFNLFSGFINAIFAVLCVVFLSNKATEFYLPYSAKDELASLQTTVLGPAYEVIVSIELRYLLAVIFGLSAIFSLLMATALRAKYEAGVSAKVSGVRWIFLGIISALSLEFASLIGGVTDLVTLKLIAGLVFIAFMLAWVSEVQNKSGEKKFGVYYVGLLAGILAWVPLFIGIIGTSLYGIQTFDWQVYALGAVLLIGFMSLAMTQRNYIKNGASNQNFLQVEGKYISTDFLIRVATFVVVFIALYN